ncbi:atlastin-3-like [Oppia nitens]|uniref:atlastin-3-like n=1 Tax=Oppia nitens TaxID=1686743 RepID=UPI0023DC8AEF|nr:atlastin-3-like [Oppia nitens]
MDNNNLVNSSGQADSTSGSDDREGSTNGSNGDYEFVDKSDVVSTNGSGSGGGSTVGANVFNDYPGQPVQVVTVTADRQFELDVDALSSILLRDSIRDKPVVVVSIAGDFRKGKSFMLNFFLRYLQTGCGSSDWLGDTDRPLRGFSWRGGSERDTTGILMWSEPFVVRRGDKEVAVILMDTQGAFDSEYTVRDSATVFALSTMTSSIQVFNLMHNLQEDNLQVLEIFTEYGRLAQEETDEKPFQKLVFLIRDWSFPYEHRYGLLGGRQLLDKKLAIKDNQPTQLQRVRRHINSCFNDIECYLLPHPGPRVATSPTFDGRAVDMDDEFVDALKQFVPLMLDTPNLVVKEIGGRQVTGKELMEYFKVYIKTFAGETMPEPKSMLEATAEANNLTAVATAKDNYLVSMEDICGGERPYMSPRRLEDRHHELRQESMDMFDKMPKMGGKEFSDSYREQLLMELDQAYEHFEAQNKSKNMFTLYGTPMVLLIACVTLMIVTRILDLVGLSMIANLASIISTVDVGLLSAYLFLRFNGNQPEVIQFVDFYCEIIWRHVTELGFKLMQNAVENRVNVAVGVGAGGGINRTSSATNVTSSLSSTTTSRSPLNTPTSSGFQAHPLSSDSLRRSPSAKKI